MKRKLFSGVFCILNLLIVAITLSDADEGLISRTDDSESCISDGSTDCKGSIRDKSDLEIRLKKWFATLKDKTFNFGCKLEESSTVDEQVRIRKKKKLSNTIEANLNHLVYY